MGNVEQYWTEHECTRCGAKVDGLHGRWACTVCGECSPYSPPPEAPEPDTAPEGRDPAPPPNRH